MLGRQQIAGIPTAIHELFKNAHDAYARRVEVDYFRQERLLLMRDDGLGMTLDEVENRWLTLGTESRLGANDPATQTWTGPDSLPRRVIMGEKGIGRLAVAAIAPVTLLITRAVRPDGLQTMVAALVHWTLFEQPGIDVTRIAIPLWDLPKGTPDAEIVNLMIEEVEANIADLADAISDGERERALAEIEGLRDVDPSTLDAKLNSGRDQPLGFANQGYGTWFILSSTAKELNADIDDRPSKGASPFRKVLLGFANAMDSNYAPVIEPRFRDRRSETEIVELIGGREFFTAEDFDFADHIVEGAFDEHGQFSGTIRFFRGEARSVVINWQDGRGRDLRCGPFRFKMGYVMGNQNESFLDPAAHRHIVAKLDELGGLYVYRDGIRVLPYGTWDYDFLNIEHRRTLSASDWFFSFRRMFGFVGLTYNQNGALREKAGREGFREGFAYRDFRSVLEGLFTTLAVRFFRGTGSEADEYLIKREELASEAELLAKRSKRTREKRSAFREEIAGFRERFDTEDLARSADQKIATLRAKIDTLRQTTDPEAAADLFVDTEREARQAERDLEGEIRVRRPRGLTLTKVLEQEWKAYQRLLPKAREATVDRLRQEVVHPLREFAADRIGNEIRLRAAKDGIRSEIERIVSEASSGQRQVWSAAEDMRRVLRSALRDDITNLRNRFEAILDEFNRNAIADADQVDLVWSATQTQIRELGAEQLEFTEAIRRQLVEFRETIADRTTVDDEVAALEQQAERLKEQLEFQSEAAQIGLAVGILGHELSHVVHDLRTAIRGLKEWADGTDELRPLYQQLRQSFEGLEGYMGMLDPLGRRITRRRVEISGGEIELYLRRIFSERLKQEGVRLAVTGAFVGHTVKCRTSALLGAFVNLFDNSLYWVGETTEPEKVVTLDATPGAYLISNNGPGISAFDAERIFEFGWSSKPGGQGLGLPIAREALRREGFDLRLQASGASVHAVFAIITINNDDGVDVD